MPSESVLVARFCPTCGHPLGDTGACAPCERGPQPALTIADHIRPVRRALALYFSLLACCIAALVAGTVLSDRTPTTAARLDIAVSIALTLVVAVACFFGLRELRPLLARTGPARWYLLAPLISIATFAFAWGLCHGVARLLGAKSDGHFLPYADAGLPWWTAILVVSLQPGIFEELAFRGLIQSWLGRVLERRETLAATALLFATIHLNPLAFVHVTVMGVVLGLVRQRTGSLYPGMLLHACHNGLVVLASILMDHAR